MLISGASVIGYFLCGLAQDSSAKPGRASEPAGAHFAIFPMRRGFRRPFDPTTISPQAADLSRHNPGAYLDPSAAPMQRRFPPGFSDLATESPRRLRQA